MTGARDSADGRRSRVLIVDDHDLARAGLRYVLGREPGLAVVGEAASGEAAIDLCERLQPDLVIMDVRMPGMGGLAALREMKARCPKVSVISLTMYEDPESVSEALRSGASGYLLKDTTHNDILAFVQQVLRGETPFNPQVFRAAMQHIRADGPDQAQVPREPMEPLTPRELDVLELIVGGKTNGEIASALTITRGTAKSHVERIIRKLSVSDRTQAAVRAVRAGLVSSGNDDPR